MAYKTESVTGLIEALSEWNQLANSDHEDYFKIILGFLGSMTGYKYETPQALSEIDVEESLFVLEEHIVELVTKNNINEMGLVESLTDLVSHYFEERVGIFVDYLYAKEDYLLWKEIVQEKQLVPVEV